MDTLLAKTATEKLWQSPRSDGQFMVRPPRVTSPHGTRGSVFVHNYQLTLPFDGWGHVYTLGMFHPTLGNLNIPSNVWVKGTDLINNSRCIITTYGESGRVMPAEFVHYFRCDNDLIVVAIPQKDTHSWIEKEDVQIKFYQGTELVTAAPPRPILCEYTTVKSEHERTAIVSRWHELSAKGHTTVYINGYSYPNLKVSDLSQWDDVEFLLDGRVIRVIDFPVDGLRSFNSVLDSATKFLLHMPKNDNYNFYDDMELEAHVGNRGLYYHQHNSKSLRQVTHNDVSIPTERVEAYRTVLGSPVNNMRLIVRDNGSRQEVAFNAHRVHELYKLPDDKIIDAMAGLNANVPEWKAANLEKSYVNRLMGAPHEDITRTFATEAFGYNATCKYTSDTPLKLIRNSKGGVCKLPPLLAIGSTVYEHDEHGMLLGAYLHDTGVTEYVARNADAARIEAIVGVGSNDISVDYDAPSQKLSPHVDYSFYLRKLINGKPTDEFYVADKGVDYEIDDNLNLKWLFDEHRRSGVIIDNTKHYFAEEEIDSDYGLLRVGVKDNIDGVLLPARIPMETVEVWLNNHPLVYGVDFDVEWPSVVVCAKAYMKHGKNKVSLRARGVSGDFRPPKAGFVSHGLLSNNSMFDVRDDKVVRIVAGGQLLHRESVVFREDTAIGVHNIKDGQPYSIDDATLPLRSVITGDLLEYRDKARDLDGRIERYLTSHIPTPPPSGVVNLDGYYHVFSPVLNRLVHDIVSGRIVPIKDDETYRISTAQLDEIMMRYNDLLKLDPAFKGYNDIFVCVHPTAIYNIITLTELEYAVVERVNHRYLNSKVLLNQYLKIGSRA